MNFCPIIMNSKLLFIFSILFFGSSFQSILDCQNCIKSSKSNSFSLIKQFGVVYRTNALLQKKIVVKLTKLRGGRKNLSPPILVFKEYTRKWSIVQLSKVCKIFTETQSQLLQRFSRLFHKSCFSNLHSTNFEIKQESKRFCLWKFLF
jgi:hypothetical protein